MNFLELEKINTLSKTISELYLKNSRTIENVGLFNGKMGIVIYFYHLTVKDNKTEYKEIADKLLDDIAEGIDETIGYDIQKGLAGIGIGIEFLVQNNYFEADTDDILEVIDNTLLHALSFELLEDKRPSSFRFRSILDILIYLIFRIRRRKASYNPDIEHLLKSGITQIINYVEKFTNRELRFFDEPTSFDMFWNLPLYLCCLAELYELKIYHYKIERITIDLSRIVLSSFPLLHSNRFYLYLSIIRLTNALSLSLWKEHALRLLDNIHFKDILEDEFKNKQVYFKDGLLGFISICKIAEKDLPEIWETLDKTKLYTKLKSSEIIKNLDTKKFEASIYGGIAQMAGIDLVLRYLIQ